MGSVLKIGFMHMKGVNVNRFGIFDWPLLVIVSLLVVIGMIMIFSTTSMIGLSQFGNAYYFFMKQSIFIFIGVIMLILGSKINHFLYQKYAFHLFFFGVALSVLPFIPFLGVHAGGATRWIQVMGVQFQPVEIVKFCITVFLATALVYKQDKMGQFMKGVFPLLCMISIPLLLLILQPDLGNTVLTVGVVFALFFIGNINLSHMASLVLSGGIVVAVSILKNPYQLTRIFSFLDPWADPLGKSYHIAQSFIAIGSGGLFGHGFGQSKLKFFYLPLHYSDFIFSIICEEGGLFFALVVLGLFAALLYRGLFISLRKKTQSLFSYYLGVGLTLFLVGQALINIGVVVGVFPVTGIPLPFISYGGSSFVMSLFFVGVLHNISKQEP